MACNIVVKNNWSQIFTNDKNFPLQMLDDSLSFFVEDYDRTEAYKKDEWDGKRHLIYKRNYGYQFRTGLLNKALLVLDVNYYPYTILDKRQFATPNMAEYQWNFPHDLWEHQQITFKTGMEKEMGIIEIGMGGGKTIIMAKFIHEIKKSANCFCERSIIARQNEQVFQEVLGRCGLIGDDVFRPDKLNVIMLQTAYAAYIHTIIADKNAKQKDVVPRNARVYKKELKKIQEEIKTISEKPKKKWVEKMAYYVYRKGTEYDTPRYKTIRKIIENANVTFFDECHHLAASTYYFVSQHINSRYIFGLSATPYRMHGDDLLIESGSSQKIVRFGIRYLIEHGILMPIIVNLINLPYIYFTHQATWAEVYRDGVTRNQDRNKLIIEKACDLVNDSRIGIISVAQINHGKRLTSILKNEGIKTEFLYSKTPQNNRDLWIPDLRHRRLDIIVSTLLGEGFDLPELEFLVFAKGLGKDQPNKLSIMYLQEAGRLMRKPKGYKKQPILVDCIDRAKWLFGHFKARMRTLKSFGCDLPLPQGIEIEN